MRAARGHEVEVADGVQAGYVCLCAFGIVARLLGSAAQALTVRIKPRL